MQKPYGGLYGTFTFSHTRPRQPRSTLASTLETFVATLAADLGADKVRLAYMEFVTPTLADMAEEAMRDGVQQLKILPCLWPAAHVDRDIPVQVTAVQGRFPPSTSASCPPSASTHASLP